MQLNLKPTSARVKDYYSALNQYGQLNISHEMAVRSAFASLLDSVAKPIGWKLVPEFRIAVNKSKSVIVDGALLDTFTLRRGYWEAKDLKDDLEKEIKKKLELGYPRNNIIFQSPEKAILIQNGVRKGLNEDITSPENLIELLGEFFKYREPQHEEWETAVAEFTPRIPDIAAGVKKLIEGERKKNKGFLAAFDSFVALCRQAINPNLSEEAVETMLIQHLLTERIFRNVFQNPEFTRRNIIAAEIEKVIDSLTGRHFSRESFLKDLDYLYRAIEDNAKNAKDYSEKQTFLNTVYERFFQSFSKKEADTHGIVYTPQPIVNFMVRSVEEILKKEFGKSLSDREVHILDPFVGTGNFMVRVMQEIKKTALPHKYANELHCNEIMLLPYYIASMNIEHEYLEATGEYKAFEGICLVDTFELAEPKQSGFEFMTEENTARVKRQRESPIFVVIGNPPYNVGQSNESDQNKNRSYPYLDGRIRETYVQKSGAMNTRALADHYVRAIRWASDRIGKEGIVALVTNNNFLDALAADGMRASLAEDFSSIYVVNLGGNVRKNPKLSGTTHNVFGIQIGVCISLMVRKAKSAANSTKLFYASTDEWSRKEQKYRALDSWSFSPLETDWLESLARKGAWLPTAEAAGFETFLPIQGLHPGSSEVEDGNIFLRTSRGTEAGRDEWAYNFNRSDLDKNVKRSIKEYNAQLALWNQAKKTNKTLKVDDFVTYDDTKLKWTSSLKQRLVLNIPAQFKEANLRISLYRPYTKTFQYFDQVMTHRRGAWHRFLPVNSENIAIVASDIGLRAPFSVLCSCVLPDFHLAATADTFRCFPFYEYSEDGTNRRENITDWALDQFRAHYNDKSITKWDIFYYTYAVLHHSEYRTRYAANLKRQLPRIPYAPDFHAFAKAGKRLAELHVDYEKQKEYPLERKEKAGEKLNLRVEKMRLSKNDAKQTLVYNDFLTLTGIPKETYDYRLGNRSALEWVIDQYQVSTDKRSGITNDPNREDDPEYILRLIGQVITVSVETVKIVNALPDLGLPKIQRMTT